MFEALRAAVVPPAPAPKLPAMKKQEHLVARVGMKATLAAQQKAAAVARLTASLARLSQLNADFKDMRRLRRVMSTYGLNKPLMAFVAPDIAHVVKNIPALESLDMISLGVADPRVKAAIEGIDEMLDTEPALVADWVRTSADNCDTLLSSASQQMKDLGQSISHYLEELERAQVAEEALAAATVAAVPQADTLACIECLLDVIPDLDAKVSNPTDRDAMDAHKAKLADTAGKLGNHTGLSVDDSNPHQLNMGDKPESCQPKQGTLVELGYTLENATELLRKADNLVDEVAGLIERKAELCGNLNDAASMVAGVDNDVPPAVDNAIADEGSDDSADGALTQADVVHCHASSHLCCIASAIEAATCAVQNVLTVAQCIDRLDAGDPPDAGDIDLAAGDETEQVPDSGAADPNGLPTD